MLILQIHIQPSHLLSCQTGLTSSPVPCAVAKNHAPHRGISKENTLTKSHKRLANGKTKEPYNILCAIKAAEKLYDCVIDFQI